MSSTKLNDKHSYATLVKAASTASIVVALLLLLSKSFAWLISDSASMLSSVTDSLLDVFASAMNFVILRYSLVPADKDHRFGHGKAESLAGLVQASFILGSCIILLLHGVSRIYEPQPIQHSTVAIGVSVFAIVLTLALVTFQRHVIKQTQSVAIGADHLHYQSDLLLNVGVIVALYFSQVIWLGFDGVFTLIVALYLSIGAIKIVKISINHLMDKTLPDDEIKQIVAIVMSTSGVLGMHELRTRQSGINKFVQCHIELDDQLPLVEAHAITVMVEDKIKENFDNTDVIIHQDPKSVVPEKYEVES